MLRSFLGCLYFRHQTQTTSGAARRWERHFDTAVETLTVFWGKAMPHTGLPVNDTLLRVLERLQGHLEVLEQDFVPTREKHLALKQQVLKHESPALGNFDPEREV